MVFKSDNFNNPLPKTLNSPLEGESEATLVAPVGGVKKRNYNQKNRERALSLRKNMTDEEVRVWQVISRRQLGCKFRRQQLIGNYIVDFICYEKKLILEIDGSQHVANSYDKERDEFLRSKGYQVERIWNNEIWENLSGVRQCIEHVVKNINNPLPESSGAGFPTSPRGGSKGGKGAAHSNSPLEGESEATLVAPVGGIVNYMLMLVLLFLPYNSYGTSLNTAVKTGLENSPEYIMEKNKLLAARNNAKSAISGFLPEISLNYQTGIKQDVRGDSDTDDDYGNEQSESISLTQPLFNGFKTVNNIKQGEFEYLAKQSAFELFQNDLIYRIIMSHLELYKWQKLKALTSKNLENYQIILDQVVLKSAYSSNNELIDYKINFAVAKQSLRDIEKNLYKAELEYQNLVGGEITELSRPEIALAEFNLNELFEQILQTPELTQKHYEYQALVANHKKQVGELLPTISLEAAHTKQTNVVYLSGEDLETKSIVLDVTVPIFKQGTRFFNIKDSEYNKNIKAEEYELTLRKLRKEMGGKYKEYNFYRNDYNQVYTIYNLLKDKLEKNQESYQRNLLDRISLLKIDIAKNDAEKELIESDINLYATYFQIKVLANDIVKVTDE